MSKNKLSHVVWDCTYHIVIIPKYRYKIFTNEVKHAVRDELKKLCLWMGVKIVEGHVSKDHIHLCVAIAPKMAVSDVIGSLKGKTAIRMFNKFPELKKRYWGCHFWSRGYFVSTVGINEEIIRQYIRNQDKIEKANPDQPTLFK